MSLNYTIREVTKKDESFLWQMLYYAAHMDEDGETSVEDMMRNPDLAKYVSGWGRAGDLGFMAVSTSAEQALGAGWVRLFTGTEKAYSQVDDHTPELAIAVLPPYLGQGIGAQLMRRLLDQAKTRYPAVALNVRADNPALRLYKRLGFVVVDEMLNRVGGKSYDMRLFFDIT